MEAKAPETGDVVVPDAVVLIDKTALAVGDEEAQGDETVTDTDPKAVILVDKPASAEPATAKELRDKGYPIADSVGDDEVPTSYATDAVVSADDDKAVIEVVVPTPEDYSQARTQPDEAAQPEEAPKAPKKAQATNDEK